MKRILFGLLYLLSFYSFAQEKETVSFIIKIPKEIHTLEITHKRNGERIKTFNKTKNKQLNDLINSYEIYSEEIAYEDSEAASLQETYVIECNDIKLLSDLLNNFGKYYIAFSETPNIEAFHEFPSFLIEIPEEIHVLEITHKRTGEKIYTFNSGNAKLDNIVNSYEIYDVGGVFEDSDNESLQNIYSVVCNDIQLMKDLHSDFTAFYPRIENNSANLSTYTSYSFTITNEIANVKSQQKNDGVVANKPAPAPPKDKKDTK